MDTAAVQVRDGTHRDLAQVLALNQVEAHWTSELEAASLARLVTYAVHFQVIEVGGEVVGFLLVMAHDSDYPNDNLRWFNQRIADFWYIDRIVVDHAHAGFGLGRRLYEACFKAALEAGMQRIVCEYSSVPMNDGSAAFHTKMGFTALGARQDANTGKVLSMQGRELSQPAA